MCNNVAPTGGSEGKKTATGEGDVILRYINFLFICAHTPEKRFASKLYVDDDYCRINRAF